MNKKIKVTGYNFKHLPSKSWKFYQGIKEIKKKKLVDEMIRKGIKSIYAKHRKLK